MTHQQSAFQQLERLAGAVAVAVAAAADQHYVTPPRHSPQRLSAGAAAGAARVALPQGAPSWGVVAAAVVALWLQLAVQLGWCRALLLVRWRWPVALPRQLQQLKKPSRHLRAFAQHRQVPRPLPASGTLVYDRLCFMLPNEVWPCSIMPIALTPE